MRETFKRLNEEKNITILISSHILSELDMLATKFCIIEKGKIIKELTKEDLEQECSKCINIKTDDVNKVSVILEKELKTTNYKVINNEEIRLYDYLNQTEKVNKILAQNNANIKALYETGVSLEDYFKSIIKEEMPSC